MAKMKTWVVTVQVTRELTLFVEARRAGGAQEKLESEEGWREATRYQDDEVAVPVRFDPRTMKVLNVKEMSP